MDVDTAAKQIASLDFLSSLNEQTRSDVAGVFLNVSDVFHYEDGEALINAGYLSFDTGYVLVDGKAAIEFTDRDPIEISAPALLGEMAQFRSADMRSATVRAKGSAVAAQFYWEDLYESAEQQLADNEHEAFRDAVERQIWQRFEFKEILNLPLFSGLSGPLRLRVCLPFPSIAERIRLKEVDTLFNEGSLCKATGYILVRGKLKLFRKASGEKIINSPDIVGIFPNKGEKGVEWTATAMASGEAELLKFSWDHYTDQLVKRLSRDDRKAFVDSLKANAAKHFWH